MSDLRSTVHLDDERLAALADEPPTAAEAVHLAACTACRRERDTYVAFVALARAEGAESAEARGDQPPGAGTARADAAAAEAAWGALAASLRAEGLADGGARDGIGGPPGSRGPCTVAPWPRRGVPGGRRPAAWTGRMPARLAAGLVVAAAAAAAGRVSATRGPLAAAAVAPGATLAPVADAPGASFASVDDAREVLARARRDYARAAAFLSADPASASDDAALAALEPRAGDGAPRGAVDAEALRARLATLDALIPGVRAAAREAPEDPAVNQLYLAAYDARETALRQLGRSLPAGVRLTGY